MSGDIRGGCIAIGNFDGVHRGHQVMLSALRNLAARLKTHTVAVTFHPHPISILRPDFSPPLLTSIEDRELLLREAGADHVVVLPVTAGLLQMSPREFFQGFVVRQLDASGIVEGPNFHFGRDRAGTVTDLVALAAEHAIEFRVVDLVSDQQHEISSSRIRRLIQSGQLRDAVGLLGHPYRLAGTVLAGAGRGATLGFPTANLGNVVTQIPSRGVYAGVARLGERLVTAAVNVGPNPTFGESADKIECHFDGFAGSLYGQRVSVDLLAEVRDVRTFSGPSELIEQIRRDVASCRTIARTSFPSIR